jgi:transposase-like protein
MKSHDPAPWPAKRERAALMLAGGKSVAAVARELGCGVRTVYDWLGDSKYRSLVSRFRHRMLDRAIGLIAASTNKAVVTLRKLLDSESEGIRLKAATSLLDHSIRMREHIEMEERIAALEAREYESEEPDFETGADEVDEDVA